MIGSPDASAELDISPEMIVALLGPWERETLKKLSRKVIHRLARLPAAGLFSEYTYTSVWGEYSHHVQNGYFERFSDLLDDLTEDACQAVAETVPAHEMRLFDRIAEARGDVGCTGSSYLIDQLKEEVDGIASIRNLERYADDYRWYENL